jgi:guanosine-3',5'-bis(diphosphate) 3'-pyrophosphohydrolase
MIPDKILEAIQFASREHHGQMRKDGETPYVSHPYRVMFLLRHVFRVEDPEVLTAGVLHDTIEDTTTDYDAVVKRFGPRVAGMVASLSKDSRLEEKVREENYLSHLAQASIEVKLCKLADTLDNLLDSREARPEFRKKTIGKAQELLRRFEPGFPKEWNHALEAVRAAAQ